jgi:hypothetical protein
LRRSHGTAIAALGFGRSLMNKTQNHREGGIGDVYDMNTAPRSSARWKRRRPTSWVLLRDVPLTFCRLCVKFQSENLPRQQFRAIKNAAKAVLNLGRSFRGVMRLDLTRSGVAGRKLGADARALGIPRRQGPDLLEVQGPSYPRTMIGPFREHCDAPGGPTFVLARASESGMTHACLAVATAPASLHHHRLR